jgi:hypothetical protein
MVILLEKAFAEISQLPEWDQDLFAAWILEELAFERLWEKAFASSRDELTRLADEAFADYLEGRTQLLSRL